jgi:cytosine/adenosine deaminase-related metal-dependent hydrolase
MDSYGLLKSDVIISHATQASSEDGYLMSSKDVWVSTTPESEGQMALGIPLTFREDIKACLGVDCHFIGPSDLPAQMRLALQLARQDRNQKVLDDDKYPHVNVGSSLEVYNMGTIVGARAVKMENQIGSLAEGKKADVIIYNAMSPTMVCAAQHDPVTAIVRHSTIRDVDTVIADGVVRKRDGKLLPIETKAAEPAFTAPIEKDVIEWKDVAEALMTSREKVAARIDKLDMSIGEKGVLKAFKIDENKLVR